MLVVQLSTYTGLAGFSLWRRLYVEADSFAEKGEAPQGLSQDGARGGCKKSFLPGCPGRKLCGVYIYYGLCVSRFYHIAASGSMPKCGLPFGFIDGSPWNVVSLNGCGNVLCETKQTSFLIGMCIRCL
jgi:hypothetical protein